MDFYCPRCATTFDEIDQGALASGQCAACQGQLAVGAAAIETALVDGLVAMGFVDGSPIGTPLQLQLNNMAVDFAADFEVVTAARTQELAKFAAEIAKKKAAAEAAAAAAEAAAAEAAAKGESLVSGEPAPLEIPAMPSVDDPPPGDEAPETAGANSADGATAAKPRDSAAVPSGLDLPSFDFSMPTLPNFGAPEAGKADSGTHPSAPDEPEAPAVIEETDPDSAVPQADSVPETESPPTETGGAPTETGGDTNPEGETPAADGAALPAHLQLPSFPKFDVNFDPGEEAKADDAAASDVGMADGLPPLPGPEVQPPPITPPGGMPAHLAPGALPQDGPPEAPPPPPEAAEKDPNALPGLPDLGLPDLPQEEVSREPTLLASEAASELAQELEKRRSTLPILIGAVVIIGLIGGALFWQRETLIEVIKGKGPGPVEVSDSIKAEKALADGLNIAKEADGLKGSEQKKRLKLAIKEFKKAVGLNPKLSQAHLRLAVAFAKTNEKAKAVKHYEMFVELDPKSPQAKEVKQIIADWYKAQEKKNGDKKIEEPEPKKKKKKKKKR